MVILWGKFKETGKKSNLNVFPRSTLASLLSCILILEERGSPKKV